MMPEQRAAPFHEYAPTLLKRGFIPIPLLPGRKVPALRHWQSLTAADITPEFIAQYAHCNVGILTSGFTILDTDVTDSAAAKAIRSIIYDTASAKVPVRIGNWPKQAFVFRCAEGRAPKRSSTLYRDRQGRDQRIEALRDGQQLGAYGPLEETGATYRWVQLDPCGPDGLHVDELPTITDAQVSAIFDAFERESEARGWERVAGGTRYQDGADPTLPVAGLTLAIAEDALAHYRNEDVDYDQWLAVGLALHHQFHGASEAFQVWNEWSATSSKYAGESEGWRRWCSFRSDRRGAVSMRTVLMHAEARGWQRPQHVEGARVEQDDAFPELPPAPEVGTEVGTEVSTEVGTGVGTGVGTEAASTEMSWIDEIEAEADPLALLPGAFTFKRSFLTAAIPRRAWVVTPMLIAGHVTVVAGPPGVSKSVMDLTRGISICTGRDLLGETVTRPGPVLVVNNEDPRDEIERRVAAICSHHAIPLGELDGRLFILSGYGRPRKYAERRSLYDTIKPTQEATRLVRFAQSVGLAAIIVDPLISTAANVNENSNDDQDAIVNVWKRISAATGAAVSLTHHTRKGGAGDSEGHAGDMDAIRGAGAIMGAARFGFTLARMSKRSAAQLGIPWSEGRRLVRIDSAKGNYTLPDEQARWLRLDSATIPNGEEIGVPTPIDIDAIEREGGGVTSVEALETQAKRQLIVELYARELSERGGYWEGSLQAVAERWMAVAQVQWRQAREQMRMLIPEGDAEQGVVVDHLPAPVRMWRTMDGEGTGARHTVYMQSVGEERPGDWGGGDE